MSSKYESIATYLRNQQGGSVRMSFEEVDEIMGGLPEAAWSHRAWWANSHSFSHARHGWLKAGWKTAEVDMDRRELRFVQEAAYAPSGSMECLCGCGGIPRSGEFLPGHEQRLRASIENSAGGVSNLWQVVNAVESYIAGETSEADLGLAIRQHWRSPSPASRRFGERRLYALVSSQDRVDSSQVPSSSSARRPPSKDPVARRGPIRARLLEISRGLQPSDLLPAMVPEASEFARKNPYAFCIAACLDRQTPAEIIWTIPYDIHQTLGHLDPARIGKMSLAELTNLFNRLPRRPRFVNDAPQTVWDVTRLVLDEGEGKAENLWKGRSAAEVRALFLGVHGVGPGIASLIVLLIERVYGVQFSDFDHAKMDIKPDVHTTRVLYRLGVSESLTPEAATEGARQLNPDHAGELDGALWRVGRDFCHASAPDCHGCPMFAFCPRIGLAPEGWTIGDEAGRR